ncbi:MAG TPA: hypothetical protein VK619_02620 [Pyrinomonadaceae bacterium]|nr:hypothetical protein [Pyrinomonadaceae bacterium]
MPRAAFLISLLSALFLCAGASNAQSISHPSPDGMSILPPNPIRNPAVSNINLSHVGLPEGEWRNLAPQANRTLPPTAVRIVGQDLHLAIFNNHQEQRFESFLAFQLKPFAEAQTLEIKVFAVEQNGRVVRPTQLGNTQTISLKKRGAVLPFTIEMHQGESLTCEIVLVINGAERGRTRIRADHRGLDFAPEQHSNGQAR